MAMTIDSVIDVFAATGAGLSRKDTPAPAEEPFRDYLEQADDNRIEESDAPSAQRPREEAQASRADPRDETQAQAADTAHESRDETATAPHKVKDSENSETAAQEARADSSKTAQTTTQKNGATDAEQSARPEITALAALGLGGTPQANTPAAATTTTAESTGSKGRGTVASLLAGTGAEADGEAVPESEIAARPRRAQAKEDQDPLLARLAATKGKANGGSRSGQKIAVQDFLKQVQNAIPANDTPAASRQNPNLPLQAAPGPAPAAIAAAAQQPAEASALQGGNGNITGLPAASAPGQTQGLQAAKAVQQSPVLQQPAAQQVAIQISRAVGEGQNRFEISLHPQELGKVEVKLEIGHDGRVLATVAAERPETLSMLRRDAFALEQALQNAGLNADSGSLQFSLSGEQAGQGFAAGDDGKPQGGGGHGVLSGTEEPTDMPEAPRRVITTSALDITV